MTVPHSSPQPSVARARSGPRRCGLLWTLLATTALAVPPVEFRLPPSHAVGPFPWEMVVGDFNEDDLDDLATANFSGDNVSVLLGLAEGGFAEASHYPAGSRAAALAVGDLNGDHHLDLVTANAEGWNKPASVSILLGRGDGTFQPALSRSVGQGACGVALADFDKDDQLDLLLAISGGWATDNKITVLKGNGDGTFTLATDYTVGAKPRSVTVGDFNHDGWPDAAAANAGNGDGTTVSVLTNRGDGTLGSALTVPVGHYPFFVTSGAFDANPFDDLAVSNLGDGSVSILLSNGDGTFAPAVNRTVGANPIGLVAGDLNHDGLTDLAVACSATVGLLLGQQGGGFGIATNLSIGQDHRTVGIIDADHDGHPDLAVSESYDSTVFVLQGRGDGTFRGSLDSYAVAPGIQRLITGEFNGQAGLDLAAASWDSGEISVLLQSSGGLFEPAASFAAGAQLQGLHAAHFTGDNRLDLVASGFDGTVVILAASPSIPGSFVPWASIPLGSAQSDVVAGDFNEDGHQDVVSSSYYQSSLAVSWGTDSAAFTTGPTLPVNVGPHRLVAEDFNGDQHLDVAVAYEGGQVVSILFGDGQGGFAPKTDFPAGPIPSSLASGDFNGDGLPDLVVGNYDYSQLHVLLNLGNATFALPVPHALATDPASVYVGDFNADNHLDVLSANYGSMSVLLGNGDGTFLTATNYYLGGGVAAVGDLDGDGSDDVALVIGSNIGLLFNTTVPRLLIRSMNSAVELAWPAWSTYQLQVSENPGSTNWVDAGLDTGVRGTQFVTTNRMLEGEVRLFRLRQLP